jgi:DNA modification methylase
VQAELDREVFGGSDGKGGESMNENCVVSKIFGESTELMPNLTELFELELAMLEYTALPKERLLERTAYIKSWNGELSRHFLFCNEISSDIQENRSALTKTYFKEGQFSTGYATHGLFPYRGKFHPQLIRALLNIMNINEGDTVLDAMAGSGTTNIEAALMGINSIAIDVSPFCRFMTQTKYDALNIQSNKIDNTTFDFEYYFNYFSQNNFFNNINKVDNTENSKIHNLLLLAYLDALGYSKRVIRSTHRQLFDKVAQRYLETIKTLLQNKYFNQKKIGNILVLDKNAKDTGLHAESVDGIITSPPYSFAIDYVENDKSQLDFFGVDAAIIKNQMIGLNGKSKDEKISNYFSDMERVCAEMARVLKKNKYCVIIIGSNTNQTGGIRLEISIIAFAEKYGLVLEKSIQKPIRGMRNIAKSVCRKNKLLTGGKHVRNVA